MRCGGVENENEDDDEDDDEDAEEEENQPSGEPGLQLPRKCFPVPTLPDILPAPQIQSSMSTSRLEATIATNIVCLRRERELRHFHLEQIAGEGAPQTFPLAKAEVLVGRALEADLRLASQRASRIHASLQRKGTDYILRDHDSHNGVFLNGIKIHSAVLRDGDVLQVADSTFVYREA